MARNGSGTFAVPNPILVRALRSSTAVNGDFASMGTEITNTLPLDGQAGMSGQFKAADGVPAAPSISWSADQNLGLYRVTSDVAAWAAAGALRFYVDANGKIVHSGDVSFASTVNITATVSGSNDVVAIEALTGTGLLRRTGTNAWSLDDGTHDANFSWNTFQNALPAGLVMDVLVPYAATITGVELLGDAAGSAVVTVWKAAYSSFPPVVGNNIASTTPPTLSSAAKYVDTTLTGWTTAVAANDVIRFTLSSVSGLKNLQVSLKLKRYI